MRQTPIDTDTLRDIDPAGRKSAARLSRSTLTLGFVSFLSDVSTEMVYPLLPLFVKDILKAPATALGLIEGVANGTSSLLTGITGWVSDRVGRRKPLAFAGYTLTALSKPAIALAAAWPVVLVARFADRLGKGIRSAPKDALIAESSDDQNRGRAFGFERTMDYAGAVAGPLIGFACLAALGAGRLRLIFILSAIPALAAALLLLSVRERESSNPPGGDRAVLLNLSATTMQFKLLLVAAGVFGLANSANAFLILRAQSLGLNAGSTVLAYTCYNAVAALASFPAGTASDRFGRRNLLIVGYIVYAAAYYGFGVANSAWLVWPLFALYGLFPALTDGVGKTLAIDTAGKAGHATAIGIYSMVIGLTQIAASYVGGLLWDMVSPRATFFFGAALAAVSAGLLLVFLPARMPAVNTR